jgi:two-component system, LytTR family, sensor histidine kinase AgrC
MRLFKPIVIVIVQFLLIVSYVGESYFSIEGISYIDTPITIILLALLTITLLLFLVRANESDVRTKVSFTERTFERQFKSLVTSVRSDRHDMNNHLSVVAGLIQFGKIEEANSYIRELIGDINITNAAMMIRNPILSAILFSKLSECKKNNIHVELETIDESAVEGVSSTDTVRLLTNLLDNAIDEVINMDKSMRRIRIEMKCFEVQNIVRVTNTTSLVEFDLTNFNLERTTKTHNTMRGYGLAIVNEIVQKHDGVLDVDIQDGEISFTIYLNARSHYD